MVSLLLPIIYMAFISLGLPDSALGSAWPTMYTELGVPLSYAGIISAIIAVGTVISSLCSDMLTKKIGVGRITALSVGITALAMLGFSLSNSFWVLCLLAVPYGLGAGSVDAALNNFVALHYASRHMSWLHCMWGVGTVIGPSIMSFALSGGQGWNDGYMYISLIQIALTAILIVSLPLWKKKASQSQREETAEQKVAAISPYKATKIKGAKAIMLTFFCYCALEQTAMLWASSYLNLHNKIEPERAAGFAGILFIGITVGRFLNGFFTIKFTDTQMIRVGQVLIALGSLSLLLPFGQAFGLIGFMLIGLGCAPIYPCIIHSTPERFGADKSQAMIGIQMASAYIGTCIMPPVFGFIANHIDVALLPIFSLILTAVMVAAHETLIKKTKV